jgi:hypothetical protein
MPILTSGESGIAPCLVKNDWHMKCTFPSLMSGVISIGSYQTTTGNATNFRIAHRMVDPLLRGTRLPLQRHPSEDVERPVHSG